MGPRECCPLTLWSPSRSGTEGCAASRGQHLQSPRLSDLIQAQLRGGDQAGGGRGCPASHLFVIGTLGSSTLGKARGPPCAQGGLSGTADSDRRVALALGVTGSMGSFWRVPAVTAGGGLPVTGCALAVGEHPWLRHWVTPDPVGRELGAEAPLVSEYKEPQSS